MELKIFIITVFIILQSTTGSAQKPGNEKGVHFRSVNQVGILAGSSDANLQLQSINGIKYKTGFVGLGVGLDYYYARSIPVFIDLRKDIFTKPITPFIYVDGGYHFPWSSEKDEKVAFWGDEKTKGGLYYDIGIGYELSLMKNKNLLFSAGYSHKSFSENIKESIVCLALGCTPNIGHYGYQLRRIALKVGFSF
jgi:hypothetical protein